MLYVLVALLLLLLLLVGYGVKSGFIEVREEHRPITGTLDPDPLEECISNGGDESPLESEG
jgi:hypothetical protein